MYLFNIDFYDRLYDQNGVYEKLNKDDVLGMTKEIFSFFKYQDKLDGQIKYADVSRRSVAFFTENEISHMVDVRDLIFKILLIFYVSLTILILLLTLLLILERKHIKRLKGTGLVFVISSSVVLFMFIILYILSMNFSHLFDNFHLLFFPQGNFMFDSNSLLITLFPFNFFYQYFVRLVIGSTVLSFIFLFIGIFLLNIHKIFQKRLAV
jgi:integral membrane protein (TIGR01906 family)